MFIAEMDETRKSIISAERVIDDVEIACSHKTNFHLVDLAILIQGGKGCLNLFPAEIG
jgi:hypothetical protein